MTSLLDSIIDAGSQLTAEQDKNIIAEKLVLMCLHYTESDLSAFYSCLYDSSGKTELNCLYKNGYGYDFKKLITTEISVSFLIDTGKAHITGKKNDLEKKTAFSLMIIWRVQLPFLCSKMDFLSVYWF